MQKKKPREWIWKIGLRHFVRAFHSSSVAVRERGRECKEEEEWGEEEKNRSSLLAIRTKLNCSSYQPMLLFRFLCFNQRTSKTQFSPFFAIRVFRTIIEHFNTYGIEGQMKIYSTFLHAQFSRCLCLWVRIEKQKFQWIDNIFHSMCYYYVWCCFAVGVADTMREEISSYQLVDNERHMSKINH